MSASMQTVTAGRYEGASQTLWYKSYPMILSNRAFQQVCCSFGFGLLFAPGVEAQQGSTDNVGRRTIRATRMMDGERITLDCRLDEPGLVARDACRRLRSDRSE
jgi:hypothetical protein